MKSAASLTLTLFLAFAATAQSWAADVSPDTLEGKWLFTHILLDGSTEMKVNRQLEFLPDGTVINYDAAGNESGRAAFEVTGDTIVYTDDKGDQNWKVVSFGDTALHVDHRGAEMFFTRE